MRWDTNVMSSRDSSIIFYLDASLALSFMLVLFLFFFSLVLRVPGPSLSQYFSLILDFAITLVCLCMVSVS